MQGMVVFDVHLSEGRKCIIVLMLQGLGGNEDQVTTTHGPRVTWKVDVALMQCADA